MSSITLQSWGSFFLFFISTLLVTIKQLTGENVIRYARWYEGLASYSIFKLWPFLGWALQIQASVQMSHKEKQLVFYNLITNRLKCMPAYLSFLSMLFLCCTANDSLASWSVFLNKTLICHYRSFKFSQFNTCSTPKPHIKQQQLRRSPKPPQLNPIWLAITVGDAGWNVMWGGWSFFTLH